MPLPSLSPTDLFWQAGPVVKGVMLLLILSSVWCWTIIAQCAIGLNTLRRAISLAQAGQRPALLAPVFEAGNAEAKYYITDEPSPARRDRVISTMRRRVQETIEREQGGLANLAVISSVAPFIGLLGTVWGIMTSFIGIAAAKDTSLAVVAPGIAEALAATAIGLAAAIPAAFAYNRFASGFTRSGRTLSRLAEDSVNGVLEQHPLTEVPRQENKLWHFNRSRTVMTANLPLLLTSMSRRSSTSCLSS